MEELDATVGAEDYASNVHGKKVHVTPIVRVYKVIQADINNDIINLKLAPGSLKMMKWTRTMIRFALAEAEKDRIYVSANHVMIGNPRTYNRQLIPSLMQSLFESIFFERCMYYAEAIGIYVLPSRCGKYLTDIAGQHRCAWHRNNWSDFTANRLSLDTLTKTRNIYEVKGEDDTTPLSVSFLVMIRREVEAKEITSSNNSFVGEWMDVWNLVSDSPHNEFIVKWKKHMPSWAPYFRNPKMEYGLNMKMHYFYGEKYELISVF